MNDWTPTLEETDEAMRFLTERSLVREGLANRATARKMVNRWLERVKAEAWDEGYVEGVADETIRASIDRGTRTQATNPYRKEQDQ